MTLLTRVNLTLAAAFVLGVGVCGAIAHRMLQDDAKREGLATVRLMLSSAAASRDYTKDEIAPLLASQLATSPSLSVSASNTPVGPQHIPAGSSVTAADLVVVESCLVKVMGPIASVLVKRAARVAPSSAALVDALAGEIDDDQDREGFRASCRRLLR